MRLFAFFFLFSSVLGTTLPLPAFAAQAQTELSEEEEIALMMEQLEQFKASWESKDQVPQAAPSTKPEQLTIPTTSKPQGGVKPAVIAPEFSAPQAAPSIKITTTQAPAAAPVQIKTQDGRILGGGPHSVAPDIKPEIKTASKKAQSASPLSQPKILETSREKYLILKEAETKTPLPVKIIPSLEGVKYSDAIPRKNVEAKVVPSVIENKKSENQTPEVTSPITDQVLLKKLSLPEKAEKKAPIVVFNEEGKSSELTEKTLQKKLTIPAASATASLEESRQKTEASSFQKTKEPLVKATASLGMIEESGKTDLRSKEVETSPEDIVVVQDEAAAYRAAREDTTLKSTREIVRSARPRVIDSDAPKVLGRREGVSLPGDSSVKTRSKWAAARRGGPIKKEPPKPNLFAETFYLSSDQRLAYDVYDIDGFIFVKSPNPDLNTKYAVVTGFGGGAMKTRSIPNLQTLEEAKKWVSDNLATKEFENVEIKKMSLGKEGEAKELYWVGQKAYPDFQAAQQAVAIVQSVVTAQGGDFTQLVSEASAYSPMTDGPQGVEIKGPANFEKEEELMLKYMDQLDIGRKLFGPFQGDASGESFTWQSFGETTWRRTNLDRTDYRSQVGYWTNRVVFKGIRFPMNTVEPFLESTVSLDSTSADFSSNMKLFAGLEWRPFARNPWLYNYRPWGGINVLEWVKNFRFYVMYGERKAIKDPIEGSADTDLLAGVQIFYEWGVELPPLDQAQPKDVSDFVERYFWGEYFGDYRHEMTNFGSEDDYNSWLGNSSITMGVKLPGIPLPENPINEELMLMPYMRFEHVNSAEFSFPYQNQYFVAAGLRVMPWRNYRYKENEWLSKAKFFGEFVGVGLTQHAKQDEEAPNAVRWDLRFGVSFSSRRY